MATRLYIPSAYVDEICPAGRASTSDWIGAPAGDVWLLATEDDCDLGLTLRPGEIVPFVWVERLGDVRIEIRDDGTHTVLDPVPDGVTHFTFGTELLADTVADFVEMWRAYGLELVDDKLVLVSMARWADEDERFQFVVDDRGPRFIRAAPGGRAQQ